MGNSTHPHKCKIRLEDRTMISKDERTHIRNCFAKSIDLYFNALSMCMSHPFFLPAFIAG